MNFVPQRRAIVVFNEGKATWSKPVKRVHSPHLYAIPASPLTETRLHSSHSYFSVLVYIVGYSIFSKRLILIFNVPCTFSVVLALTYREQI